jgi:Ni2+-binding GTPase involved in maturation of urease and hydrogenase
MDLAPHLDIDVNRLVANVRQMNPDVTNIPVSAKTGEGLVQEGRSKEAEGRREESFYSKLLNLF